MCSINPVRGVELFQDKKRDYRLSEEDYRALGEALRKADSQNTWPAATALIRFLALAGWRSGEALALHWDELDLPRRTAFLADTKTGRSMRPLSNAACAILVSLPYQKSGLVFPAARGETLMNGFKGMFRKLVQAGGLSPRLTPHVLRHSFASAAADLGFSDVTIAGMLGHAGRTITSRYTHAADSVLLAGCDVVANHIRTAMADTGASLRPARSRDKGLAPHAATA
jgi:integrase